jgi:hypothetical protein
MYCTVYIFSVSYCLTVEEIHEVEDSTISTVEAETAHAVALRAYLFIYININVLCGISDQCLERSLPKHGCPLCHGLRVRSYYFCRGAAE